MTYGYDRWNSPDQAVRDERAVERARAAEAEREGPVSASAYYRQNVDDHSGWVFPRALPADAERRLLAESSYYSTTWPQDSEATWIFVDGGADNPRKASTRLRVELIGTWVRPVFVNEIRAQFLRRSEALCGSLVWRGAEGGGDLTTVALDLDAPNSVARQRNDDGTLGKPYANSKSLTLNPGEPFTFEVVAFTANGYCEWVIDLSLTVDGAPSSLKVNHGGRPFRTTSIAETYSSRYRANINTGRWVSAGPGGFDT